MVRPELFLRDPVPIIGQGWESRDKEGGAAGEARGSWEDRDMGTGPERDVGAEKGIGAGAAAGKRGRDRDFVFLRIKERFLVPDHKVKDISGASFAGMSILSCPHIGAPCREQNEAARYVLGRRIVSGRHERRTSRQISSSRSDFCLGSRAVTLLLSCCRSLRLHDPAL